LRKPRLKKKAPARIPAKKLLELFRLAGPKANQVTLLENQWVVNRPSDRKKVKFGRMAQGKFPRYQLWQRTLVKILGSGEGRLIAKNEILRFSMEESRLHTPLNGGLADFEARFAGDVGHGTVHRLALAETDQKAHRPETAI